MPRFGRMIMLAVIGSLLSTALAGCAHQADRPAPAAIAVKIEDPPSAELLVCPIAPAGFPEDAQATMPAGVRSAAIALATAYAGVAAQLARLINWNAPGRCTK